MIKYYLYLVAICICTASCISNHLPDFSNQTWHVDPYTGHAVNNKGFELAFGSEWMITDTTLFHTQKHISIYPDLEKHLYNAISQFPEIAVDSILFYNPHRGLLFTTYHQVMPLKPTSEIYLDDGSTGAYSKEFAQLFGQQYTSIDDTGFENGPSVSAYTNVRYRPNKRMIVMLQRLPFKDTNIAIFQIWATNPRKNKWWEKYPPGTFWRIYLGNPDNIEQISSAIQSNRNLAVENLKLALKSSK